MRGIFGIISGIALGIAATATAPAQTQYPLANPGFESPPLDAQNSWYAGVSGWGHTLGVGTTYELPWVESSPAPEGSQYLYGDYDGFDIWHDLGPVSPNTRYQMLVDLYPLSTGTSRVSMFFEETDTWSAVFSEAHYQPTWDPTRTDFVLLPGQWVTAELRMNSAQYADWAGNNFRLRINGSRVAVDNVRLMVDDQPRDFHISSSSGSDWNDGRTDTQPWESFDNLWAYLPLLPGESVLLKAGDTFTQELNIRGKGTVGNPVTVGRYGSGPNPVIQRQDIVYDRCLVWNNASNAVITGIDGENAKLGIYLRYEWTDWGSENVLIEHCNFRDMPDPTLDPAMHNYEIAWSNGIFVGGQAWGPAEYATRLTNLTIRHVTATNCAHLFGTAWYYPGVYKSRLVNLVMEDCYAFNCLMGSISLISVDGGHAKRVHAIGGGGKDTWAGTTLAMIQSSQNFLIEDCEFSYMDRAQAGDGSGVDFEGNTRNVTLRNCTIHHNDAAGVLILTTDGPHENLVIENNTFYNNARNPWNSEINSEIQGSDAAHTGIIRNNGIYRGDTGIHFLSPSANWSGFSIYGNRYHEYASVSSRPTWWNFDNWNDPEGWNTFHQWDYHTVSEGVLWGLSTGYDPFGHSPATWTNTTLAPYVWVRMKQTEGNWGQVYFITETDPAWNQEKHVPFPIIPDGQMHDYFIDLGDAAESHGVVTQVRLDPTIAPNSLMAIDFVRLTDSTDPGQSPPPPPPPALTKAVFTSIASEDGHVLESAWNSGVGGSRSTWGTTMRLGDDASNRAYRMILSFDTSSLPSNAIIEEATIGITRIGNITGNIPIGVANSEWGDILVDIANPSFGSASLANSDWQATATKPAASKIAWPAYKDKMTIFSRLEPADNSLINTNGRTQFRIRYENDDNGNGTADYVSYATSNHGTASYRPTLTIKYRLP